MSDGTPAKGRRRTTNAHTAAAAKTTRNTGAAALVQQYFMEHPDGHVWASDIMTATGLPKSAVQSAVTYLRRDAEIGERITTIRPGNAWRLRALSSIQQAESDPKPYAGVGNAIDIKIVGRYADGSLALEVSGQPYHAKPLR